MTTLSELQRELQALRADLGRLRDDTDRDVVALGAAVRRHSVTLAHEEVARSIKRLAPPVELVRWTPRVGQDFDPDLNQSLIERLKRGDPVADTVGNTEPLPGQTNILDEQAFDNYAPAAVSLGTTYTTVGHGNIPTLGTPGYTWQALRSNTSCTATTNQYKERDKQATNPFNSAAVAIAITASGAGTHAVTLDSSPIDITALPQRSFLVAAIRCARLSANTYTNVTSRKLYLDVWDNTSSIARASTTLDLTGLSDVDFDIQGIDAAVNFVAEGADSRTHSYVLRLRLEIETTGPTTGAITYYVGEPLLHFAFNPTPVSFTPAVAGWLPNRFAHHAASATSTGIGSTKLFSDSYTRWFLRADGTQRYGGGAAAQDLRTMRGAAKRFDIDDTAGGAATLRVANAEFAGRPWHDVRAYGATGDGVTNDAAEIQAAVDAAIAEGGGTVFLPPGTYKLGTTTIWLTSDGTSAGNPVPVNIVGAGAEASIVTYTGSGVALHGGTSGAGYSGGVALRDFQLDGTSSTGNARGVYLKRIYRPVTITRMQISDFAFAGVHLYRCYGAVIRDSRIGSCGWGVMLDNANGASMFGNRIVTGVNGGIRLFKNGTPRGTLAADASAGATNIKVSTVSGWSIGDDIQIGTAGTRDVREITNVGTAGAGGTGLTITPATTYAHTTGDDLSEIIAPYDETGTASANYAIVGGTVEDCTGPGISVEQVSQAYIAGVYIEGNGNGTAGQVVIGGADGGSGGTASKGISLVGNRFQASGGGTLSNWAVQVVFAVDTSYLSNWSDTHSSACMRLDSTAGGNVLMMGNNINDTTALSDATTANYGLLVTQEAGPHLAFSESGSGINFAGGGVLRHLAPGVVRLDNGAAVGTTLEMIERGVPSTPGTAGALRIYASSATKTLHHVDDAGVDTDLGAAGTGAATQASRDAATGSGDYVARIRVGTESNFRAYLRLDTSNQPELTLGPGTSATDLRLARTGTRELTIDDDAAHANPVELFLHGVLNALRASTGSGILAGSLASDSAPYRFVLDAGGGSHYGPGGSARDLAVKRGAASRLDIDDDSAGPATLRVANVQTKGRPWFDVRAYGAVGDGTTDDTTAIQSAIDAAEAEARSPGFGAVVYFPIGDYKITDSLTVEAQGVILKGAGRENTIIRASFSTAKTMLYLGDGGTSQMWGIQVQDLFFVGSANVNHAIYLKHYAVEGILARLRIEDCTGSPGTAIYCSDTTDDQHWTWLARDLILRNNDTGIALRQRAQFWVIDGCTISVNNSYGVDALGQGGNTLGGRLFIQNSNIERNGSSATDGNIYLRDIQLATIRNVYSENNVDHPGFFVRLGKHPTASPDEGCEDI